jgi:hypothetical protein
MNLPVGVTSTLTPALSPGRGGSIVAFGSSSGGMANPVGGNFPERGNDYSLSLGERAGVRASVKASLSFASKVPQQNTFSHAN